MEIFLYDDGVGKVELVDSMGSDTTIVNAARVSFGVHKNELDDKDIVLIKYLLENKHTSVLEHCLVTFRVKVPLFVRSQHHRHRTFSYNEISRRYTSFDIEFYEPQLYRKQSSNNRQASTNELIDPYTNDYYYSDEEMFECEPRPGFVSQATLTNMVSNVHKMLLDIYNMMLDKGVCREQARGILPQNMYTEYYATVNLNNLFKFIELRSHEGAQWEIQQVAFAMLQIHDTLYPITMKCYKEIKNKE